MSDFSKLYCLQCGVEIRVRKRLSENFKLTIVFERLIKYVNSTCRSPGKGNLCFLCPFN